MKRYKITLMVPHSTIIEAPDIQEAHNEATRMLHNARNGQDDVRPKLHMIEEFEEIQVDML